MNAALMISAVIVVLYVSYMIRNKRKSFDPEFDLATVNEKMMLAEKTRINLNAMEQLATDIAVSNPDMQIVINMQWLGYDGEMYSYDLFLDGYNTATESMAAITERESSELREQLAYQCSELNNVTMRRHYDRQNVPKIKAIGEWLQHGQDVREMWNADDDS